MRSVTLLPARMPGMKSVSSPPATKTTRPGWAASRPCRRLGRCDQSGRGFLRRVLEEGRREPHLEAESERDLGDRRQPSDVTAHDPHGVGVEVIPDDLELAAHHRQIECRAARRDGIARAAEHGPCVVVDSLVLHVASITDMARRNRSRAARPGDRIARQVGDPDAEILRLEGESVGVEAVLAGPRPERLRRELHARPGSRGFARRQRHERLLVCGLRSQGQLGIVRRERLRVRLEDRLAPLDRAVAVGAHFAPVDGEHRALSARQLRERPLAQDRNELLAERPRARFVDVALQAEQAPRGHLACGDFVHDRPTSTQSVDEVRGELAARRVGGLDFPPVRGDALCGIGGIAREHFPDRRKRQLELAQHRNEARLVELRLVVVAIARDAVDACRHQHPELVIEPEGLDRQARPPCELADADFCQRLTRSRRRAGRPDRATLRPAPR